MKALVLVPALVLAAALLPPPVHAAGAPPANAAVAAVAPRCAASVEEAARGIVGGGGATSDAGYRVQDLLVDPVLRKAWVRVADCHDARRPLTLVALETSVANAGQATTQLPNGRGTPGAQVSPFTTASSLPLRAPTPAAPVLIAQGDTVEVLVQSSSVHMRLQGHAASSAIAGGAIDIALDAAPGSGEPAHHMRGLAVAPHRVEVQQ